MAVPEEDMRAIEEVNERPPFPNPLPTEFALLLGRAWKQQSRDRLPQVGGADAGVRGGVTAVCPHAWACPLPVCLLNSRHHRHHLGSAPLAPLQIITLMQTLVLGFLLAALFSDIQQTLQGIQDELGVIFMACMFNAMASLFASLNTFPQEAGVINRWAQPQPGLASRVTGRGAAGGLPAGERALLPLVAPWHSANALGCMG